MSKVKLNFQLPDHKTTPPGKAKKPSLRAVTLKEALIFIKNKNFESEIENELIKRISRYPSNCLNMGLKNIEIMVTEISNKIKEDQPEETPPSAFAEFLKQNLKETNEIETEDVPTTRASTRPGRKKFKEEGNPSTQVDLSNETTDRSQEQ